MSTPTQVRPKGKTETYSHQVRAFKIHASVFAATMVLIFIVNLVVNLAAGLTGEWWAWWSGWVFLGWGLGVTIHGLVLFFLKPTDS